MKTEAVKENGNEFFVTQYIPIVKFFLKKKNNLEVFPSFLEEVIGIRYTMFIAKQEGYKFLRSDYLRAEIHSHHLSKIIP